MSKLIDLLEPNNLRPLFAVYDDLRGVAADLREDASFVRAIARAFGPARHDTPPDPGDVFAARPAIQASQLARRRVAVVASGGSGATASLVGVQRAFEDAAITPVLISACSGSVLFASLWACGFSAADIAKLWLTLPVSAYVDPQWRTVARGALHRFRGTTGLLAGEAIERTFERVLGKRTLGETTIPFAAVMWNIDENRVEYFSTRRTPDLPLARVVRTAISIPIMVEPVRIGGYWYGDGGIVDLFPTAPLDDVEPVDLVIGTNTYLPEHFAGTQIAGWYEQAWSVLRASGQLRYAIYLELAREHVRRLGSRLELLHPVPDREVRGAKFYESFLDRRDWPRYMRAGHEVARGALVRREAEIARAA